jgi:pimeloyl-ACP methyl ester carboxylesterase
VSAIHSNYLAVSGEQLHYLHWGNGSKLLLAFHGYGNDAFLFQEVAECLDNQYTFISIDLPFHGKSRWHRQQPILKKELEQIVRSFMHMFGVAQISLLGFSIGGRVVFSIAERMPELVQNIVLVAPDGLVPNRFYKFVMHNSLGSSFFNHFLRKPNAYLQAISWLTDKKLLHPSRKKFVAYYTEREDARLFLKNVWYNLSNLIPDINRVKQNIGKHNIPVHLVMGNHDRVIPIQNAQRFAKDLSQATIHVMAKGHKIMDSETTNIIAKILIS